MRWLNFEGIGLGPLAEQFASLQQQLRECESEPPLEGNDWPRDAQVPRRAWDTAQAGPSSQLGVSVLGYGHVILPTRPGLTEGA